MSINLKELLKITPEGLAKKQFEALKSQTLSTLEKIIKLIKENNFSQIRVHIDSLNDEYSGEQKNSILFDFSDEDFKNDILDVVERLEELKKIIK